MLAALPLPLQASDTSRNAMNRLAVAAVQTPPARIHQISLKQLGARVPISLRGVDGRDGVNFNVRTDEVVTQARLKLLFSYSPALLTDISHINVLVNGEVGATINLPKDNQLATLERTVDIAPQLITESNKIEFQLIGHYTTQCEDPAHSSLWANISNKSTLEVTSAPVTVASDLKILPLPFLDQRDARPLQLPFVFVGPVDNKMLQAAGTVSSWFGAFATYRGVSFPASLNAIPASGHAVVFVSGEHVLPGVSRPAESGPMLSIVTNPNDPAGKLLLITGQDSKQLRIAATALATNTRSLEGSSMLLKQAPDLPARQPYDAPNWLSSQRPVKFSELGNAAAMNVSGHDPGAIRLNMRVPPDLFQWKDPGIPVALKYRYTPPPAPSMNSTLLVNFNEQFVKSVPLAPLDQPSQASALLPDKSRAAQARINVPTYTVGFQSQMQLNFKYDYQKEGECRDIIVDNMRGAIEPDSSIDISAYPHYLAMPNLAAFSSSGFPFTRLADLSETAVILPDAPSLQEYTTYLGLMGKVGESTGYPATAVSVARAAQIDNFAGMDLLLIASGDNQPLLKTWRNHLPVQPDAQRKPTIFGTSWNPFGRFSMSAMAAPPSPSDSLLEGTMSRAVVLGFESPLTRGRSAVLLWGAQPNDLNDALVALVDDDESARKVQGAVAVIRGKSIDSSAADPSYHVGSLPWTTAVRWRLSENLPLFLVASLASALLLAALLYAALKGIARKRVA